ncbi:MAG: hypothetical protein HYX53_05430 [Chloroflexi bacterium]|nr:hypothetical protein [Chloroflexota bacterium]
MHLQLTKPWRPLTEANVAALGGNLGVYQLANDAGEVVFIGFAGGKSLFGLRSALAEHLAAPPAGASQFRVEVNQQYQSRYRELLMVHRRDTGGLPVANRDAPPVHLGRLS